jgi:alkanesulfonate monooxygenase SsuD/methylene tetrahydromethanopterin reductase-like flavin-dependent oxidoreductase (luciferase family)
MKLAITIEGMCGLTWPRWKRLVSEIERMGFAGLFRSDHFTLTDPPDLDSLELIVSLTYLASHSQYLHFGSLVAPLSFRDPIFLARQAMAMDDLSGGRMILGVGAGWLEREHTMFGYDLADVSTRIDRLEEGLEVITRLIRDEEPVTFKGSFYQLQEAHLLPRPQRSTPVLVGGNGPKRTLPLVARYADIWNCLAASPEVFKERSALLDELLYAEGRQPEDVKRTMMLSLVCWRDQNDLERRMNLLRDNIPHFAGMSTEQLLEFFRTAFAGILGTPESVNEQLSAYASVGVEELILQWFSFDDIEGLEIIAEHVLPHFTT